MSGIGKSLFRSLFKATLRVEKLIREQALHTRDALPIEDHFRTEIRRLAPYLCHDSFISSLHPNLTTTYSSTPAVDQDNKSINDLNDEDDHVLSNSKFVLDDHVYWNLDSLTSIIRDSFSKSLLVDDSVDAHQLSRGFATLKKLNMRLKILQRNRHVAHQARILRLPAVDLFLGQIFLHKKYGYRGVIISSFNPPCPLEEEWIRKWGVRDLPHGVDQPFYRTLICTKDRPAPLSTFAAQDNLQLIASYPRFTGTNYDGVDMDHHGQYDVNSPNYEIDVSPVEHPFMSEFFDGFDPVEQRHIMTPEMANEFPHDI